MNLSQESSPTTIRFHWRFFPLLIIVVLIVNAIRLPIGFKSFWAEDGRLFFQAALDNSFPLELMEPRGGYLNLIAMIIGRLLTFVSLAFAPAVNFIITSIILALMVFILYSISKLFIVTLSLRVVFSLLPVFIPIAGFESLIVSSQLHFFLPFICLMLIFSEIANSPMPKFLSGLFILLSCLSDPMSVFILPGLCLAFALQRKRNPVLAVFKFRFFLFCMVVQTIFTILFLDRGGRDFEHSIGYLKTWYLFLDRVVGSALIPNWGFVNGVEFASESPKRFILRAFLAIIVLIIVVVIAKLAELSVIQHTLIQVLGLSGVIYWVAGSLVFNPEPRYAIFPSMCVVASVLIIVDALVAVRVPAKFQFPTKIAIMLYFSVLLAFSWEPSTLRSSGVSWERALANAQVICRDTGVRMVDVEILPQIEGWSVNLPCESVLNVR